MIVWSYFWWQLHHLKCSFHGKQMHFWIFNCGYGLQVRWQQFFTGRFDTGKLWDRHWNINFWWRMCCMLLESVWELNLFRVFRTAQLHIQFSASVSEKRLQLADKLTVFYLLTTRIQLIFCELFFSPKLKLKTEPESEINRKHVGSQCLISRCYGRFDWVSLNWTMF